MSACITPIFLHVAGRINQGGHTASPGQPLLCIHSLHCVATPSPLPSVSPGVQLSLSSPSTSANRSKEVTDLPANFSPAAALGLKRSLSGEAPGAADRPKWQCCCRRASGTLRAWLEQPLCTPQHRLPWSRWDCVGISSTLGAGKGLLGWWGETDWLCLLVVVSLSPVSLFPTQIQSWDIKSKNHFYCDVKSIGTITDIYPFLFKMRGITVATSNSSKPLSIHRHY